MEPPTKTLDSDVRVWYKGTMIVRERTKHKPVRSIPGEHQFLTTTDGEFLVREDRCRCGKLLGRSNILIGQGGYYAPSHGTVCKYCKAEVLIILSTGP